MPPARDSFLSCPRCWGVGGVECGWNPSPPCPGPYYLQPGGLWGRRLAVEMEIRVVTFRNSVTSSEEYGGLKELSALAHHLSVPLLLEEQTCVSSARQRLCSIHISSGIKTQLLMLSCPGHTLSWEREGTCLIRMAPLSDCPWSQKPFERTVLPWITVATRVFFLIVKLGKGWVEWQRGGQMAAKQVCQI